MSETLVHPRMDTPVVVVVFKRVELTRRLIDALRPVAPRTLFVVADGPRDAQEAERCEAVRQLFETEVDWPCEIHRDFAATNLGCGKRLPTGLDKVFEQVERAIIFEDDCIPDPTFFPFCEALLAKYADDEGVGCISGDTVPGVGDFGGASYRFSWLPLIWGWATWRRAWAKYDFYCGDWPASRRTGFLRRRIGERVARKGLADMFDEAQAEGDAFHAWDFQWTYACLRQGMRSIHPPQRLVSNIGVGPDATHTKVCKEGGRLKRAVAPMTFPLHHPMHKHVDRNADARTFYTILPQVRRDHKSLSQRVHGRLGVWRRRWAGATPLSKFQWLSPK